jgi:hypothetical protein
MLDPSRLFTPSSVREAPILPENRADRQHFVLKLATLVPPVQAGDTMTYTSSTTLMGLPLVHVAIGPPDGSPARRGIARGWIAVGDISFGVVFALGGIAVGGLGVGGLSVGVLALAGLSIGVWSVGGLAIGAFALGGGAIAAWAATGGLAIAREYASGGLAIGANANTDVARTYFASHGFFRLATQAARYSRWLLILAVVVPIVTTFLNRRRGRPA